MSALEETATDALHDYARLKLELAAIVRAILHLTEKNKDELATQDCRRVLARLAEDRFNLAVVGQFSRGKSSLMNALLGTEKLPTGVLPLTSVVTTVTYGEKERVLLLREGWTFPQQISLAELPEYVTQGQNPGNEKKVLLAEIQLPHELLRLGVHFVDTPGIASSIAANTRTTREFLPEADAAILVTSFESPMTEAEIAFFQELRTHVHKIFIVVNKLDLVSDADRDSVLDAVRDVVRGVLPESFPMIFALSARQALVAKRSGSSKELHESGLPPLEDALSDFLRTDKAQELLLQSAARVLRIAHRVDAAVHLAHDARGPQQRMRLQARLTKLSAELSEELDAKIRMMQDRLLGEFVNVCLQIAPLWGAETQIAVGSQIQSWLLRSDGIISGEQFKAFVQTTLQSQFALWISMHRAQMEERFRQTIGGDLPGLEELSTAIAALPINIADEERDRNESHIADKSRSSDLPSLALRELQVELVNFEPPWWYDLLPRRLLLLLAERWRRRAPELKDAYERAACSVFSAAMNDWIEAMRRDLESRLDRIAGQMRELLADESDLAEGSDVTDVMRRLEAFVASVLRVRNAPTDSITIFAAPDNPVSLRPCEICLTLERQLRSYMAHRQYELAVSEKEQSDHALHSGFCPFHTWQYEAVASPQGVCAAYAELMALYAKELSRLAEDDTPLQQKEGRVKAMLPTQESCPACRLMHSTEQLVAREIATKSRDEKSPPSPLCALHLLSVLEVSSDQVAARRLLAAEAHAFQSLAEDMQNHILKHEAVRHSLSTNAEQEAATTGLAFLIGRRNLFAPWRIE